MEAASKPACELRLRCNAWRFVQDPAPPIDTSAANPPRKPGHADFRSVDLFMHGQSLSM
jgi:hypothetical protein